MEGKGCGLGKGKMGKGALSWLHLLMVQKGRYAREGERKVGNKRGNGRGNEGRRNMRG